MPKLSEIQETISFILNLSINVNSDVLYLDQNHSYDVCREIKKKIKVDLKEVIEKECANKKIVNSVMQDIDESYLYSEVICKFNLFILFYLIYFTSSMDGLYFL